MGHFLLLPAPHGGGFVAFCALLKLLPTYIPGWGGGGSGFTLTGALDRVTANFIGLHDFRCYLRVASFSLTPP